MKLQRDADAWEIKEMSLSLVLLERSNDKIEITDPFLCKEVISSEYEVGDFVYADFKIRD